jgi:hypothetical protein
MNWKSTARSAVVVGAPEVVEYDGAFGYWLRRTPAKFQRERAQSRRVSSQGGSGGRGEARGVKKSSRGCFYL